MAKFKKFCAYKAPCQVHSRYSVKISTLIPSYSFCLGILQLVFISQLALAKEENITFPLCKLRQYPWAGSSKNYTTSCLKQPEAPIGGGSLFSIHQVKGHLWAETEAFCLIHVVQTNPNVSNFSRDDGFPCIPYPFPYTWLVYHGWTHGECLKRSHYVSGESLDRTTGRCVLMKPIV